MDDILPALYDFGEMATESGPILLTTFLERARCSVTGPREQLQALLDAKFSSARAAWPEIALEPNRFGAYLGERVLPTEDACDGLAKLREQDMYLACATLTRVPGALDAFERTVMSRVGSFIARIDSSASFADEVTQAMRVKLMVPPERADSPKLAQYSGRGALDSWVCAVATRLALDLVRARRSDANERELNVIAASHDPELEALRAEHRDAFRLALQDALGQLEPRRRTLLRLYYLEHVTFQELGRMYQVHETTAMRWVEQAKTTILTQVHAILRRRLNLSESEFSDLGQLLQSQLDLSLGRLLSSQLTERKP
jgi:RNA polymerase sigma-70 factor